ncbi:MAG: hypothetical protein RJQ07_08925 [Pseudomonadales bacterium]
MVSKLSLLCCLSLCLQGFACSAQAAANETAPTAALAVSWVDWPDEQRATAGAEQAHTFRDRRLEREVIQQLQQVLGRQGIAVAAGAEVRINVTVKATRVIRQYTDSLFGSVRTRPTEYRGEFTITVSKGDQQQTTYKDDFSINHGRTVGDTTSLAQAKVRGMISKWLAKHVQSRKFRKLFPASSA